MIDYIFLFLTLFTFTIFAVPIKIKYWLSLILLTIFIGITSVISYVVIRNGIAQQFTITVFNGIQLPTFSVDVLSAFFILVINFTTLTGLLYARSYLAPYLSQKPPLRFSIHYFSYLWLYLSMVMVCSITDGFPFLIVWELMSLSSFLLVVFDAEDRDTMKAGINYFIQMHVGFLFLMVSFLIIEQTTGNASFYNLGSYFSNHNNVGLFLMFFVGFGIKAGFIPLHSWLPLAHPAAPSHVSGVMSGVMIKMGIFGILRVVFSLQDQLLTIGSFVLTISIISGLLGVMYAIVQHDIKRLLAYHSIENIGIIGIGIGLGLIGKAIHQPVIELLGFGGGLLHVLNHSLFKSLLFYNAGSIYSATHTRNIEKLGGLIKKMPYTAILFLIGAIAICGLPPFNGFISEYLIYSGMFKSFHHAGLYESFLLIGGIIGLALIGGLAIFCFTKAFGVIFLGNERSNVTSHATEINKFTKGSLLAIVMVMLLIGLVPILFVKPIFGIIQSLSHTIVPVDFEPISYQNMNNISITGGILVMTTTLLLVWRYYHQKRLQMNNVGSTWGCGYTAGTAKHQYTATSYADNFIQLAQPVLQSKKEMLPIASKDIFPTSRHFATHQVDILKKSLIDKPIDKLLTLFKHISVMQTGQIQHYILYAFAFMLIIFLLTFFNLI